MRTPYWPSPKPPEYHFPTSHLLMHICHVAMSLISKQFTKGYMCFSSHCQLILREMLSVLFVSFMFSGSLAYFGQQVCVSLGRYVGPSTARPLGMLIMQTERLDRAWPPSRGYGQQKSVVFASYLESRGIGPTYWHKLLPISVYTKKTRL